MARSNWQRDLYAGGPRGRGFVPQNAHFMTTAETVEALKKKIADLPRGSTARENLIRVLRVEHGFEYWDRMP